MKIKKTNELLWLLGTIFVAIGVSICSKADLGVSMIAAPAFVLSEALCALWTAMNVGVTEYVFQGILLVLLCVIVRRWNWRYLLAFVVAVLYGYTLNLFMWIFGDLQVGAIWVRWVMLLLGDCFCAMGVACYFRTYLPLQVYELFVAETARCYSIPIGRVKWCFDMGLFSLSAIMACVLFGDVATFDWSTIWHTSYHNIGLGTLVTTVINSAIISFMGKALDRFFDPSPCFSRLQKLLQRT